jgi:uncharacterized protein YecE (DUF72 family)
MITVGCAGFPVPATRYFKEFLFVEIPDTHLTLPGTGTIRRWRREAPPTFEFAVVAPREIGQESFRAGKVIETALESFAAVGKELRAKTAVFLSPPDFASSRANKAAVKDFLASVKPRFGSVVWEAPPAWDAGDAQSIAEDAGVVAALDPLTHGLSRAKVAYYRLPGPAGHKSRYEDPAIETLAELARSAEHDAATYVFTNVDMFADAKRLQRALKS